MVNWSGTWEPYPPGGAAHLFASCRLVFIRFIRSFLSCFFSFFFDGRRFRFSGCGAGVDCGIPFVPLSVSGNIKRLRQKVSQVARRSIETNRHSGVKTKQLNTKIEAGSRTLRVVFIWMSLLSFFLRFEPGLVFVVARLCDFALLCRGS